MGEATCVCVENALRESEGESEKEREGEGELASECARQVSLIFFCLRSLSHVPHSRGRGRGSVCAIESGGKLSLISAKNFDIVSRAKQQQQQQKKDKWFVWLKKMLT